MSSNADQYAKGWQSGRVEMIGDIRAAITRAFIKAEVITLDDVLAVVNGVSVTGHDPVERIAYLPMPEGEARAMGGNR